MEHLIFVNAQLAEGEGTRKALIDDGASRWLRYAMFGSGSIEPLFLVISVAVTIVCAVIGIGLFNHVEKTFIDTV